jgi:hypothetical protein
MSYRSTASFSSSQVIHGFGKTCHGIIHQAAIAGVGLYSNADSIGWLSGLKNLIPGNHNILRVPP